MLISLAGISSCVRMVSLVLTRSIRLISSLVLPLPGVLI